MFDLRDKTPKYGGISENNDVLKGYEEVNREDWINIELRTYIRYEKTDGKLVKGGFIISKSIEKGLLFLQADLMNPSGAKWSISISSIVRLWKKSNSSNINDIKSLVNSIRSLNSRVIALEQLDYSEFQDKDNDQNDALREELSNLNARISNMENDIRKLLGVINEIVDTINNDGN